MRSKSETYLGITPGEPAGIGPDICLQAHDRNQHIAKLIYYADPALLRSRAELLGLDVPFNDLSQHAFNINAFNIQPIKLGAQSHPGNLNVKNAAYVISALQHALHDCVSDRTAGIVTGPVQKSIINEAGLAFSGHTEWLAEKTETDRVVMMLTGGGLRVALATTHLPLSQVSAAINQQMLRETIEILHQDLIQKFGLAKPRILVCGLNPHAGEQGHLGHEEMDIIEPLLEMLRTEGMLLTGPLPADTAFNPPKLAEHDAVLAMYHDQGLPVLKHASFGNAINVTLGLPIIRTSVDHGTALDIAGSGKADPDSLTAAIKLAAELAQATP